MIAVVDYGLGNLGSIANMLKRVGAAASIVTSPELLANADAIILPGVGAFDEGMGRLRGGNWIPSLETEIFQKRKPLLGICLGMQLLMNSSEEGVSQGLGWISGRAIRFRFPEAVSLPIPHMGWSRVRPCRDKSLFQNLDEDHGFYFVHSYHVTCQDGNDILATTDYGCEFVSAVQRGNIMGVQFHPEKSHKHGMNLFQRFVEMKSPC